MTPDETSRFRSVLCEIVEISEAAFVTRDRGAYARIERKLEGIETCKEIEEIRAYCTAGPGLLSPRFGFPHIANVARRLIARTPAVPPGGTA